MKLRNIALTSVLVLAVIFMVAEYNVTHIILNRGFEELEHDMVTSDARRVRKELSNEVARLDTFLWDWSSWDDTYQFVNDGNPDYPEANLGAETFAEQNLNLIVIIDNNSRMIFGRGVKNDGTEDEPLLYELMGSIRDVKLPQIKDGGGSGGFVITSQGPLIFSSRPILKSGGEGPAAGTMLMARFISEEMIEEISERLEMDIAIHELVNEPPDSPLQAILEGVDTKEETQVVIRDEQIIDGYAISRDVFGIPALLLQVTKERRITQHGHEVTHYNGLFLIAVLAAYCILIFVLLRERVLTRLELLNRQLQQVDLSGGRASWVTVSGNDEISQLATNVNLMLKRIDEDRQALREAHDGLEREVAARTAELEKANTELKSLDRAKSQFLSSTSHELRTPLTAIHGFIKLMERTFSRHFQPHLNEAPETASRIPVHLENYKIVHTETERLGRLIDDLLDLSKIEAGRMEWRDSDVDPAELVTSAVNTISGQFDHNPDVELRVSISDSLPTLHVDRDRVHQVLMNLLNNAAKFTEEGFVEVRASDTGKGSVEFLVEDSGRGIDHDDLPQLFDVFFQAQTLAAEAGPSLGTGLGLTICKEIVEHYGGTIYASSEPGEGSCFVFTLPIKNAAIE